MTKKTIKYFLWFILAALVGGVFYFWHALNVPLAKTAELRIYSIKPKEGSWLNAQRLEKQGFIRSGKVLEIYWWYKHLDYKLKPGDYQLSPNMSALTIGKILTGKGLPYNVRRVTVPEGFTAEQIMVKLLEAGVIADGKEKDFLAAVKAPAKGLVSDYNFLKDNPSTAGLEGFLFPETQEYFASSTNEQIIRKFLDQFDRNVTADLRREIARQKKTIFEVVTLASIVEKEVSSYADRQMVADVFLKRLKIGMPLQSDATVNYITKKGTLRPSLTDLSVDSRYNTYKYKGLPPGPICNPSLAAIKAVVYPKANDYYYFITDKRNNVIFAETGAEHNQNIQKYLE